MIRLRSRRPRPPEVVPADPSGTDGLSVPVHPETVEGHSDRLRWVVPPEVVPFVGPVRCAPDGLGEMLSDGALAQLCFEPNALVATVGCGRSWREVGPAFRLALIKSLADADGWSRAAAAARTGVTPPAAPGGTVHGGLAAIAGEVIDGAGGDEIRSHGGSVELVEVTGEEVVVRLGGACHGCPAADATLQYRLEAAIRARHPALSRVRRVTGRPARIR